MPVGLAGDSKGIPIREHYTAPSQIGKRKPLRHTFGTNPSAVGVHPRIAMAAMRHSRIELTMNLYTDPALLDVAGAINSLPTFGTPRATAYAANIG